jgi:hypothetical protein
MPVEAGKTGSNNTPKIQERLLIDLVPGKQFCVIAKVMEEPAEFPKCAISAVEAPGERKCFMGDRLEDAEAQGEEGFLRMPAIGGPLDSNQEEPVEIADQVLLARMQTGNVSPHDLASPVGCA